MKPSVKRCPRDEESAQELTFEDVAQELAHPLGRYLRHVVADRHLAEDLLQETLLRIARGLPDFEGRSSVKTWAYTIATRTALDQLRKTGIPVESDAVIAEFPDEAPTPDQHLAIEQMNACVRELIATLPEQYRVAILLHDFGGLSAREIAAACGCSEANAKMRIHRARARLKTALQNECYLYHDNGDVLRCHRRS